MGEQYIDLFAAAAYALEGKLLSSLAQPQSAWVFYVLAAAGLLVAVFQGALERNGEFLVQHLVTVAMASVLILLPCRIDLGTLAYAAPGAIEKLFGTKTGAAPHLTYLVERLGSVASRQIHEMLHSEPVLAVPSVASQIDELTSDARILGDPQLRANLEIWRTLIAPLLLRRDSLLAAALREQDLTAVLLNPTVADDRWVDSRTYQQGLAVRALLGATSFDLVEAIVDESALLRELSGSVMAEGWTIVGNSVRIPVAKHLAPSTNPSTGGPPGYSDALKRGVTLAQEMLDVLPTGGRSVAVTNAEGLYDMLGRSIYYVAGATYLREESNLALLGSYCQRLGASACHIAQAQLSETSRSLRIVPNDQYNTPSVTTLFKQPLATLLLTIASLLLDALSGLVVAVLPFLLGVAKVVAILMSSAGLWMMLWPGRLKDALSWMILPVAFVALWSILFSLWSDMEPFLDSVGSVVSHAPRGSFSAGRIMSIAISVGYLGLPAIALSILSGSSLRAMNHASARLETAFMLAWRMRRSFTSAGRRWLTSSPLARRWNQRAYRAVGLGALRFSGPSTPRARRSNSGATPAQARRSSGGRGQRT